MRRNDTADTIGRLARSRGLAGIAALALLAGLLVLPGCGGGLADDPILQLSAAEALAQGKQLMAEEKYNRARPYLVHAFEVEPNSVTGREALLLAADTFYLEEGDANFIQAEAKYRDYLNRFPTSEQAAYAQYQVGNSLAGRMERPDRDQKTTREALTALEELLRLYPTSEYAAQARQKIVDVRANLAEHEFVVGHFYLRFGLPVAALGRLEYLLDTYPAYGEKDKILYYLGQSYLQARRPDDALASWERLEQQFPESEYIADIPDELPTFEGVGQGDEESRPSAPEVDSGINPTDTRLPGDGGTP